MRRKRFKHQAYIFCHMFCGWQLANDLGELKKLEKGTLEIDVKNGLCNSHGEPNKKLTMPLVLNDWFMNDIKEHNIKLEEIDKAWLTVNFDMHNLEKNKEILPEFKCKSYIASGDITYELDYQGEKENNTILIKQQAPNKLSA